MRNSNILMILFASICAGFLACEEYDDEFYDDDSGDEILVQRASSVVDTYQAEDRSFQNGCKEMSNNAGFTGRGFMDYGGNRTLIEWNDIDAPSAGQYTLVFRYANGSGGNRQCRINVNDRTNAGNVAFAKTGSWTTWRTKSIKVTLKQGNNKIRVTANTGAGGPNLDKMDLISEGDPVVETDRCALVNENSTASLSCPGGQVVKSIDFASYGLPTGSCTAGFSIGTCHASTSKSKVQSLCLNQQSCRIGAKNAVFGDPCAGKRKKLAVLYTCSGATTGVAAKDFVGHYERTPVLNNWHKVDITLENNALWWKNAAGRRWSLSYANGELKTGSDCPYGVKTIEVEKESGSDPVKSLKFNGGQYHKNGGDDGVGDQALKVFILAGQSNMVGQGTVNPTQAHLDKNGGKGTLKYLVTNAGTRSTYAHLTNSSGGWASRADVRLADLDRSGPLTITKETIGPELQFGHVLGNYYDETVLIIKISWGGKSLFADFRPPSSGGTVGPYYTAMIQRIHQILNDIRQFYPSYGGKGYEIVGFGWHQGWNDRINTSAVEEYQTNCVNLINDLRRELNAPKMGFVLATTGMGGWNETHPRALALMKAQLAVPQDSRIKNGNVLAVETRSFWRDQSLSPSNQNYHWNRNAETYLLIGGGMGEAMIDLIEKP